MNKLKKDFEKKFKWKKGTKCINCNHVRNWHDLKTNKCNALSFKCKCKKYEVEK